MSGIRCRDDLIEELIEMIKNGASRKEVLEYLWDQQNDDGSQSIKVGGTK